MANTTRSKSAELKLLEGNPGKRPIEKNTFNPPVSVPKCPSWIDEYAKREWKRIMPLLKKHGLISNVDRMSLAALCQAWAELKEATETIRREGRFFTTGSGYKQKHPAVDIQQKAFATIKTFSAEYGLTPAARGRIVFKEINDNHNKDGLLD